MSDKDSIFTDIMNFTSPVEGTNLPALIEGEATVVTELEQDFELSRNNLREIAELSQEAMQEFAKMTKQMQDPRAYSTFAKLLTAAILAQKAVVEVHKNKIDAKTPEDEKPVQQVTHNTLVMTTDQMLDMLERRKNENRTQ